MTNFLHWRNDPGPRALLAGMIVLGSLRLPTQPLFQEGRGLNGFFIRPGWTDWRLVDLHRTHRPTEPGRRHAG